MSGKFLAGKTVVHREAEKFSRLIEIQNYHEQYYRRDKNSKFHHS